MKEIKPGYKETSIGILPKDWEVKKFSECFSYGKTDSHSREKMTENNEEKSEILNIHYGDIHTKYGIHLDIAKNLNIIPALKGDVVVSKNIEYLKDGDLIIADASEDYKDIGKSIEIKNIGLNKVIGGLHTILARGNEFTVKNYRGYILKNNQVKKQIDRVATGISVLGLSKTNLDNILIPIPPKEEQEKIAQVLMTWDEAIEKQEELIEQEKEFKKGMMQKIFSQKLRFKDENGNDYPEWQEKTLGEIGKLQGGYAFKSELFKTTGIPIMRISNISNKNNYIDKSNLVYYDSIENFNQFTLKKGDLIIAMSGATTGKLSIYNLDEISYLNQRVGLFKIDSKIMNYKYAIQYCFSKKFSSQIKNVLVAGAQPNISSKDIENFIFLVPSLPEQEKIADFLSIIDEKIEILEKKLEELKEQKKGLMQKLLTGEVRV